VGGFTLGMATAEPPAVSGVCTPALALEKHGPAQVQLGQPVAYEIVVRNVGRLPAAQVRVEDGLPPGVRVLGTAPQAVLQGQRLAWTVAQLPPGQEARFRVEVMPSSAGELVGSATVSAAVSAEVRTRVLGPGLEVAVEGPVTAAVGQSIPFKIRVSSRDAQAQRGLVLRVQLSEGLRHPMGKEIEADLGDLDAGKSRTIDLPVSATAPGRVGIEALVMGSAGKQARGQGVVVVTPAPAAAPAPPQKAEAKLLLRMNGPEQLSQGQKVEYKIGVVNRGPVPLSHVIINDRLPEGLTFLSADNGGTFDKASRNVLWQVGTVPPHQERTVTLKVQAREAGNQVPQVWAEDDQGDQVQLVPTPVQEQATRPGPMPPAAVRGRSGG
jgi:uncharacterized repeat protein (TIGR01451 family)